MIAFEEPRIVHEDACEVSKPHLPARAHVVYRVQPCRPQDSGYLLDLAESAGLGGLFLVTDQPLPPGTVLTLEIEGAGDQADVLLRGQGIVRSRRRWGKPRGMQVELFELEELGLPVPVFHTPNLRIPSPPVPS